MFSSKVERLKDRAHLLKMCREFFDQLHVLEVDCPILSASAAVDAHIDLITACYQGKETRYLHSSPEYGMKRLLAEGMGDIYQLSHVFRDGEWGKKHNPEFMMLEWYRLGFTLEEMIRETVSLMHLFLGELPYHILSYRDAFLHATGIDYLDASKEDLFAYIQKEGIPFYASLLEEDKDAYLNVILASQIEPYLGKDHLCVLAYYPASQAALAKKRWHEKEHVAERFEVYYRGVELANGYHELTDAIEQRQRFEEANVHRMRLGKETLPLDEHFLHALSLGLPECSGVAVGFDRLMLLRQNQEELADILSWGWGTA